MPVDVSFLGSSRLWNSLSAFRDALCKPVCSRIYRDDRRICCSGSDDGFFTRHRSATEVTSVHGIVLNGVTNQPIARALVQTGTQSILTEHEGKFEFSNLTGTSASIRVTKPGFYQSSGETTLETTVTAASAVDPVEILLYPEALLTGTVSAANGDPLAQVRVLALRKSEDDNGARWVIGGQASTNSDGQFRLPLASGDYVLQTQYVAERPGVRQAILPLMVPATGGDGGVASRQSTMHLTSGSELRLDLKPELRSSHDVYMRIENAENQFLPQIEAHINNLSGLSFYVPLQTTDVPGDVIASLPSGSYLLTTTANGRDQASFGETRVTVTDRDVSGVVLRLSKAVSFSIEVATDASSTSDNQPPSVQQLGAFFARASTGPSLSNQTTYFSQGRNPASGITLLPGSYRLRAQSSGQWYIRSATLGGTDLLAQELAVDEGGSALPLRLVVSDQTGTVKATVKAADRPAVAWVYLLATTPTVTPIITSKSSDAGVLSRSYVPPGDYRVVALEARSSLNLNDPDATAKFASYFKAITVAAGETVNVDLDAVPASELQ